MCVIMYMLGIVSFTDSGSKKRRLSAKHSDVKERGGTPAKGMTASFLQLEIHSTGRGSALGAKPHNETEMPFLV